MHNISRVTTAQYHDPVHPRAVYRGQLYVRVKRYCIAGDVIELWATVCPHDGCATPFLVRRKLSQFVFGPKRRCAEHASAGVRVEAIHRAVDDETTASIFISAAGAASRAFPIGIDEWSSLFLGRAKDLFAAAERFARRAAPDDNGAEQRS